MNEELIGGALLRRQLVVAAPPPPRRFLRLFPFSTGTLPSHGELKLFRFKLPCPSMKFLLFRGGPEFRTAGFTASC